MQYELVTLYHPDLEIDLDKALKKVEGILKNNGGKILYSDTWGKRKLAYPIKKQDYAIYTYSEIELPKENVAKVESLLNITDEVIRYLIATPTPNFGKRETKSRDEDEEEKSEKKEDVKEEAKDEAEEKK